MMTTAFAVATPHALILTVSHGLLFRQSPSFAAMLISPFLTTRPTFSSKPAVPGRFVECVRCIDAAILGAHRSEPRIGAAVNSSRNLNYTALTIGFTAVLRTPSSCARLLLRA
jgi:hypothetical protein